MVSFIGKDAATATRASARSLLSLGIGSSGCEVAQFLFD